VQFHVQARMLRHLITHSAFGVVVVILFNCCSRFEVPWERVFVEDFTDGVYDSSQYVFTDRSNLHSRPAWQVDSTGLQVPKLEWCWPRGAVGEADARVVVELSYTDDVNALELCLNSENKPVDVFYYVPPGLSFQFGGYGGILSHASVNSQQQRPHKNSSRFFEISPGQSYRVTFEYSQSTLSISVNKKKLLSVFATDLDAPLQWSNIGFRSWARGMRIQSIEVWRPEPVEQMRVLARGDSLSRQGQYEAAVAEYVNVSKMHPASATGINALLRAYRVSGELPHPQRMQSEIELVFIHAYAKTSYYGRFLENKALIAWNNREYQRAMDLLPSIFEYYPETKIAALFASNTESAEVLQALFPWLNRTKNLETISFQPCGLSTLKGFYPPGLKSLDCSNQNITSLEPLRGLALQTLYCSNNQITSVDPLAKMPLEILDCEYNAIRSLSPLQDAELAYLYVTGNDIASLEPVQHMPLVILRVGYNPRITSLDAMRTMPLRQLWMSGLDKVANLEPLRGKQFSQLFMNSLAVTDLKPLEGMQINVLSIDNCPVTDLSPLGQSNITTLKASGCALTSLAPLKGLALEELEINFNNITSLDPLEGMPLRLLSCYDNSISSLTPLKNMPLATLYAFNNPLPSLHPFEDNPPQDFLFGSFSLQTDYLKKLAHTWGKNTEWRYHAHQANLLIALQNNDAQRLRQLAQPFEKSRYIHVPIGMPWDSAQALATRLGGHLAVISSKREQEFIAAMSRDLDTWIGMQSVDGTLLWINNQPETYTGWRSKPSYPVSQNYAVCTFGSQWLLRQKQENRPFCIEWDTEDGF